MYDDDPLQGLKGDQRTLTEARDRFRQCQEREAQARIHFRDDMKFANGDAYNNFQWPGGMVTDRGNTRPTLTINKTRQHCLQIVNDARQNKAQIEVRPVGGGASYQAAEIFEGVVRHIEYISNAQAAYDCASWNQVTGGIGWWRITTDYATADSDDQEIYIRRVADALSIYLDPDIQEYDGSDARYGFVYRDMPRDAFRAAYPAFDRQREAPLDSPEGGAVFEDGDGWDDENHVRVCEYYRKTVTSERRRKSGGRAAPGLDADYDADGDAGEQAGEGRPIERIRIDWYLIAGGKVVERKVWPGNFIPLVRVVGEETVIDNVLDRRGHVRALIDPQRIYNYWSSSAVEYVALQTKSPYIGPAQAFEGNEDQWSSANTETRAYLAYNQYTDDGQELREPRRADPPQMPQAYIEGLKIAAEEMRMASGQYQADMGAPSNERSGKAIQERQRQGDNATYHYIEHLSQAIRFTGRILIDLIPHIYDTDRVIKILAADGTQSTVQVAPGLDTAHAPATDPRTGRPVPSDPQESGFDPQVVAQLWNPSVGRYDVEADMGPAYSTRRQEAFDALSQIIMRNQSLMPVIGDLMFRAADFPMASEIAERLQRMVPPQATGQGPDPAAQQAQAQLQQAHAAVVALQRRLEAAQAQTERAEAQAATAAARAARAEAAHQQTQTAHMLAGGEQDREWYEAETKRLSAMGTIDPAALMPLIRSMVSEVLGMPAVPVIAAHQTAHQAMQPPAPMPTRPAPTLAHGEAFQ